MQKVVQKFTARRILHYTQKILLQGLMVGSVETKVEFSINVPKYILKSSDNVKGQVMRYVRDTVHSKNRPHIHYNQATHLNAPVIEGPNTRLGKVKITITYLGMRDEFIEQDIFFFIKSLRKSFREIYKIHSK